MTERTPLPMAVVGYGHLGVHHAAKIQAHPAATLAAVVDVRPEARERAQTTGAPVVERLRDLNDLPTPIAAIVIASTTSSHRDLLDEALDRGWHVLVEKPITDAVETARPLVEKALALGRVLAVGHTERHNPAVAAALEVADRPRYIVAERLGPFTGRSTDVDVILDLMIHDLDIVASLVPAPLTEVRAVGVPVLTSEVDMASARLAFEDGTVAQLSAGRASLEPTRKIRLFTQERYLSIDCAAREVKAVRRLPPEPGSQWPQISGEPVEVADGDPLTLQLDDFIRAIFTGGTPKVDGAAGLRALALAQAIKDNLTTP